MCHRAVFYFAFTILLMIKDKKQERKNNERNDSNKFWDDGATISFVAEPIEEKDKSYIKGLIKAIESYNPNYNWNWEEQSLKDKFINVNFSYIIVFICK